MTVFKAAATLLHSVPPPLTDSTASPSSSVHSTGGAPSSHAWITLLSTPTCLAQLDTVPKAMKLRLYFSTHRPSVSKKVVVGVLVTVVVVVGVVVAVVLVVPEVVAVVVWLDVTLVVGEDVTVVDRLVVCELVTVVVADVVGVVTSQSWKLPTMYASAMMFKVAAAASQLVASTSSVRKAHLMSSPSAAGPRYSRTAAFSAAAV